MLQDNSINMNDTKNTTHVSSGEESTDKSNDTNNDISNIGKGNGNIDYPVLPLTKKINNTTEATENEVSNQNSNHLTKVDDGRTLLYPNVKNNGPFKTVDRLIDDIICSLPLLSQENLLVDWEPHKQSILRSSTLLYSQRRQTCPVVTLGSVVDQLNLSTKYEYASLTCPDYNKIETFFGSLLDTNSINNMSTVDHIKIYSSHIYSVKITVKTRSQLELYKRHAGISQFFMVDELHPYDKEDLSEFDPNDEKLLDYAMFVSSDTNKLILIEIFKPEFNTIEESNSFTKEAISKRYNEACLKLPNLDPDLVPSQFDCIHTLYKLFRGPLNAKDEESASRTIYSKNPVLNAHLNVDWLVEKYGFTTVEIHQEDGSINIDYKPPNLLNYKDDLQIRKIRQSFILKCLHLIFLAKWLIEDLSKEDKLKLSDNSKAYKFFSFLNVRNSLTPLYQLFGSSKSNFLMNTDSQSPLDTNYHFINLSTSYYYADRDIIANYEILCNLDPKNIGVYYDALSFIANRKGSYQLLGYCGKQDIIGHEAITSALQTLKLDPEQIDLDEGLNDDNFILSIYRHEKSTATDNNRLNLLKNAVRVIAKFNGSEFLTFYINYEPYMNVSQAYTELEINENVDDDIVQTAYTIKINDMPGLKMECDKALYTIAIRTRSMTLFNYLVEQCPEFLKYYSPDKFMYSQALDLIQVNENANDETILKIFQHKWENDPISSNDQFLNLKAALTKICSERNSKLISNFLSTGLIDPNCLPADNWPTGLNNIGNTCYLNSLLQYYFAIEPLREYICNYQDTFDNMRQKYNESQVIRRIGGREVSSDEVERSIQFTYQLRDLFQNMIQTKNRCVTPTQELAYLAFSPSNIPVEFESNEKHSSSVSAIEYSSSGDSSDEIASVNDIDLTSKDEVNTENIEHFEENAENDISDADGDIVMDTATMEELDRMEQVKQEKDIETSTKVAKISLDQLENTLEIGRQQDVTECIGNVLYQLESASTPISIDSNDNEQDDLIKQLFYGKTKQEIVPLDTTKNIRTKFERFLSLMVNVSDHPKNIYDALDAYFMDEKLTLEEYGEVQKKLSVTEFPRILQIQIQRVYYDREKFMPFKSIEPLPFNQILYMDRYMDNNDPELIAKRLESQDLKEQLKQLRLRQVELLQRNGQGLSQKESLMETNKMLQSSYLQEIGIDSLGSSSAQEELIANISGIIQTIDEELTQVYNQIQDLEYKIDHLFDNFQKIAYSLFAVFIHRGEASYGHYWVYVRDMTNSGIWRKYNDETVTEVPESEVFNFVQGNTATPYFLVLVQREHEKDIAPLKRNVVEN